MFTIPLLGPRDGERYRCWAFNGGESIFQDFLGGVLNVHQLLPIFTHIYVNGCRVWNG